MAGITNQREIDHAFTILDQILAPANAQLYLPFLDRVDPVKLQLPDYEKFVKEPMWLRKIQSKFHESVYESIKEFVCDFRLMLLNCYRYNGVTSRLGRVAEKLELLFEQKLNLLPSEIKSKTTLQATLCGLSPEEELIDYTDFPAKRRNTTRLLPAANSIGRSAPIRTIMEEFERSKLDGLFSTLLGEGIDGDSGPVNEDEGVALIVSRLNSWQRKRHDQQLIATWPDFWSNENKHSQARLNQLNTMSDFFEVYQLVFAFDEVIGISDILSAVTLFREMKNSENSQNMASSIPSLFYQHRRLLSISELELAYSVDVKRSLLLSVIFHSLLVLTSNSKDASELNNALEKYRTFKNAVLSNSLANSGDFKGSKLLNLLRSLIPEDYGKWTNRLKDRLDTWYTTHVYAVSSSKPSGWLWRRIGVMDKFFETFGTSNNPLETTQFHEFSLYQQVLLTKTLFENVLRTHAKTRTNLDRVVDWTEIREHILGKDPIENTVYLHMPGIFSYSPLNSIRVYKMTPFTSTNWDAEAFIASLNLKTSPGNSVQLSEETALFNPQDDSIENSFYHVPGPIYHLPRWLPESLAGYAQKRWLSLLNTQVLLQQAVQAERAADKKGNGPKAQELKRLLASGCKWLPMGSMEALYAAEGKNHTGKYTGGQRTKTAHLKRQEVHASIVERMFDEEPVMEQSDYFRLRAPQNAPYPPGLHGKVKALTAGRLDLALNDNNNDDSDADDESMPSDNDDEREEDEKKSNEDDVDESEIKSESVNDTTKPAPLSGKTDDNEHYLAGRSGVSEETGDLKLKIKLSPRKLELNTVSTSQKLKEELAKNVSQAEKKEEAVVQQLQQPQAKADTVSLKTKEDDAIMMNPDTPSTEPCDSEKPTDVSTTSIEGRDDVKHQRHHHIMANEGDNFSLVANDLTSLQKLVDNLKERYDHLPEDGDVDESSNDPTLATFMSDDTQDSSTDKLNNSRKRKSRRANPETPASKRLKKTNDVEEYIPEVHTPKRSIGELISALTSIIVEHEQGQLSSRDNARLDAEKLMHLRFRKDFEAYTSTASWSSSYCSIVANGQHASLTDQFIQNVTTADNQSTTVLTLMQENNDQKTCTTTTTTLSSSRRQTRLRQSMREHQDYNRQQQQSTISIQPSTKSDEENNHHHPVVDVGLKTQHETRRQRPPPRKSAGMIMTKVKKPPCPSTREGESSFDEDEEFDDDDDDKGSDYHQDDDDEREDVGETFDSDDYSDDWAADDDDSYDPSSSRHNNKRSAAGKHSSRRSYTRRRGSEGCGPTRLTASNFDMSNVHFIANRPLVPIAPKPSGRPIPLFLAAQRTTNINGQPTTIINSRIPILTTATTNALLRQANNNNNFNPRQVQMTTSSSVVTPTPTKNIFRIKDILFTEDVKPVKIVQGKIVPANNVETIPAEVFAEARTMIEKYKANTQKGQPVVVTMPSTKASSDEKKTTTTTTDWLPSCDDNVTDKIKQENGQDDENKNGHSDVPKSPRLSPTERPGPVTVVKREEDNEPVNNNTNSLMANNPKNLTTSAS